MKITRKHLTAAVDEDLISADQANRLWTFWDRRYGTGFNFTSVLYYFGGLVAIGAMTIFMNLGWESFGGWGIFAIALGYAGAALALAYHFQRRGHTVPATLCATFVVALTPLALYGLLQGGGWWPDGSTYRPDDSTQAYWIALELGTLLTGMVMVRLFRHSFLVMPLAVALWLMSMDVGVLLADGSADFMLRATVSLWFGVAVVLVALWVDMVTGKSADYAFWLYLFGVAALWSGLSVQVTAREGELSWIVYLMTNLVLICGGVLLMRRVFVVFGAFGCALYLGHLAATIFAESWLFPFMLTAIGLGIIYLGILWQRNEEGIARAAQRLLPVRVHAALFAVRDR